MSESPGEKQLQVPGCAGGYPAGIEIRFRCPAGHGRDHEPSVCPWEKVVNGTLGCRRREGLFPNSVRPLLKD